MAFRSWSVTLLRERLALVIAGAAVVVGVWSVTQAVGSFATNAGLIAALTGTVATLAIAAVWVAKPDIPRLWVVVVGATDLILAFVVLALPVVEQGARPDPPAIRPTEALYALALAGVLLIGAAVVSPGSRPTTPDRR